MDKLRLFIGLYGELLGLIIIGLVSLWDFLILGARGFLEYRIAPAGIVIIWLGLLMVVWSKHLDKYF